jgi:protein-S-isoprenylcysteine O-methyltransferase Ste14
LLTVVFAYLPVAAIAAVGLMAAARIVALRRRGIKPVVNDPQRSLVEKLFEASTMFLLLFAVYLIIDYADGRGPRWLPAWLDRTIAGAAWVKILGAALLAAGVVLYAAALLAMGDSWRMGIDRDAHRSPDSGQSATLVTTGVYARSRNPIYLAFDLIFLGSFAVHGRVILLIAAVVLVPFLHVQILREERFLAAVYGERFGAYRRRMRRYL